MKRAGTAARPVRRAGVATERCEGHAPRRRATERAMRCDQRRRVNTYMKYRQGTCGSRKVGAEAAILRAGEGASCAAVTASLAYAGAPWGSVTAGASAAARRSGEDADPRQWLCPNDRTICATNASSAQYSPNFVRNTRIKAHASCFLLLHSGPRPQTLRPCNPLERFQFPAMGRPLSTAGQRPGLGITGMDNHRDGRKGGPRPYENGAGLGPAPLR